MNDVLLPFIQKCQTQVNQTLRQYLREIEAPAQLREAMAYSLMAGGKRIRPVFLMAIINALGGKTEDGLAPACAVEMVHTYSLIHDDLPAMDDDDVRRGKPTNHKVFGEAMAILAGDALLTHAFHLLAQSSPHVMSAEIRLQAIRELSYFSGAQGMVGGQAADLLAEGKDLSLEELTDIHQRKTGDLLVCSVRLGCLIGGADENQLKHLSDYARHIGLAFQIQDDILDEIGDEQKMGKKVGSDRKKKKTTYASISGLPKAKEALDRHVGLAKQSLSAAGVQESLLSLLADYMLKREN